MRNYAILILIALLLAACGVIYFQIRSATLAQRDRNLEAKEFKNKTNKMLSHISHRDSAIQVLFDQRDSDSVRHSQNQSALKTRLNALRTKVTGPAVVQDTIIIWQDSLIADLEQERDTLYLTDNQAID